MMEKGICYIVGAGEYAQDSIHKGENDLVIAADGGCDSLLSAGICPDIVMGDMDSVRKLPEEIDIKKYPVKKDFTDMMIAVKYGLEQGYHRFVMSGALGGRYDHTIANLSTLKYLENQGAKGVILGEDFSITTIKNETIRLDGDNKGIVSLFAMTEKAYGVTIKNLMYELEGYTLEDDNPLGISNEFIGKDSSICVTEGMLLMVLYHNKNPWRWKL